MAEATLPNDPANPCPRSLSGGGGVADVSGRWPTSPSTESRVEDREAQLWDDSR